MASVSLCGAAPLQTQTYLVVKQGNCGKQILRLVSSFRGDFFPLPRSTRYLFFSVISRPEIPPPKAGVSGPRCRYLSNLVGFISFGASLQKLLHFRFYRLFLFREGLPFYIWFYPHMMDYDVALHNLEGLFVAIPTSPRTSKTESG